MYKILIFIAIFLANTSCEPKILPTVIEISPNEVLIKFSHMSNMEEFARVAMECAEYNINFQYTGSEFFQDKSLRNLAIQVTMPNGKSGSTKADLTTLQYKYYGIVAKADGYFKIGHIE
ncbi:MAG: hypothetical protein WAT79_04525 [Saprospiraceae bacterium]